MLCLLLKHHLLEEPMLVVHNLLLHNKTRPQLPLNPTNPIPRRRVETRMDNAKYAE
jgi:hypothetical protein